MSGGRRFPSRTDLARDSIWRQAHVGSGMYGNRSSGLYRRHLQFRLYIGLISSIPVYKKVKNKQRGHVDGPHNGEEPSDEEEDVPRAKETKVVIVQDYLEQSALPGKQLEPGPDKSTVEAQRLRAFLDDMETSIKVFLSSYMCHTGLIWLACSSIPMAILSDQSIGRRKT